MISKIGFEVGGEYSYSYMYSADGVIGRTWKRQTHSLLSKNIIRYYAVNWFSFGLGGSIGFDIQEYDNYTSRKKHVGVFFTGNIHSMVTFYYKKFIIELEVRSFDRFRAYGGSCNIGFMF